MSDTDFSRPSYPSRKGSVATHSNTSSGDDYTRRRNRDELQLDVESGHDAKYGPRPSPLPSASKHTIHGARSFCSTPVFSLALNLFFLLCAVYTHMGPRCAADGHSRVYELFHASRLGELSGIGGAMQPDAVANYHQLPALNVDWDSQEGRATIAAIDSAQYGGAGVLNTNGKHSLNDGHKTYIIHENEASSSDDHHHSSHHKKRHHHHHDDDDNEEEQSSSRHSRHSKKSEESNEESTPVAQENAQEESHNSHDKVAVATITHHHEPSELEGGHASTDPEAKKEEKKAVQQPKVEEKKVEIKKEEVKQVTIPKAPSTTVSVNMPHATDLKMASIDAFQSSFTNMSSHEFTWQYCDFTKQPILDVVKMPFCAETATNEQKWQLSWFGQHVLVGHEEQAERFIPSHLDCIHLPPNDYRFAPKYPSVPAQEQGVHWPNFRVNKYEDLIIFNEGTPKNLYHFNAPKYDEDGYGEMQISGSVIPWGTKVRNLLDVGAGGGSLGVLLRRAYDVQTIATAFPDWPYCEYMTERGEMCVYVDVMEAMPFSQYSFDAIHVSWVYHGQQPNELIDMFVEIDRVLRPGGYLWQRGGYSLKQVNAMKSLFKALGYTVLSEELKHKPEAITKKISFGPDLPYEVDWHVIYVKPIRAIKGKDCPVQRPAEEGKKVVAIEGAKKANTQ